MTREEHRAEQRKVVQRIADEQGIALTPERWRVLDPMIEDVIDNLLDIDAAYVRMARSNPVR